LNLLATRAVAATAGRVRKEQHMARQYELVYILPPDTTETQATELHDQVQAIVSRMNGQIEKTEVWGRRKLAYEIGPHREGFYVLEVLQGSGDLVKELDRRLKVIDMVVRHLIVRVDEEKKVVERTRSKRQADSERRRVRRGLPAQRQPGEGRTRDEDDTYSDLEENTEAGA
jgi:small subunit ribosomal protein S6